MSGMCIIKVGMVAISISSSHMTTRRHPESSPKFRDIRFSKSLYFVPASIIGISLRIDSLVVQA